MPNSSARLLQVSCESGSEDEGWVGGAVKGDLAWWMIPVAISTGILTLSSNLLCIPSIPAHPCTVYPRLYTIPHPWYLLLLLLHTHTHTHTLSLSLSFSHSLWLSISLILSLPPSLWWPSNPLTLAIRTLYFLLTPAISYLKWFSNP